MICFLNCILYANCVWKEEHDRRVMHSEMEMETKYKEKERKKENENV